MGYTSIQVPFRKQRFSIPKPSQATTVFNQVTQDLRDLPQQMKPNQALKIVNYFQTLDGGLEKRKGFKKIFEIIGNNPITMAFEFTPNIVIFAYSTIVAAYDFSTNIITNIKTNFINSNPFSGSRYGDYAFVCNKSEKIGRISRIINYNTLITAFNIGSTLKGQTSGATAIVLQNTAISPGIGYLTLGDIQPNPITGSFFQIGEIITDNGTVPGSATTTSTITWQYDTITTAPIAAILKVIQGRLFAGNLSTDMTAVAYSLLDNGSNPPFIAWNVSTGIVGAGLVNFRNAGQVNAIDALGSNIVILASEGKWAFTISSVGVDAGGSAIKDDIPILQRVDFGGARGTLVTPDGMYYVNKGGFWQLQSVGQSNVPFSEQENDPATLLGSEYFENANLNNVDIAYLAQYKTIIITLAKDSTVNNTIISYNTQTGTISEITGWSINRFINIDQEIYGVGAIETKMWHCFSGYDDDGNDIWTDYYQELQTGGLETRQKLDGGYVDAFLSPSTILKVCFDIYDVIGNFVPNKKCFLFTSSGSAQGMGAGYGTESWGDPFGGDEDFGGMVECFDGFGSGYIRNYQRLRIHITNHDKVPHKLVWVKTLNEPKVSIRRRHLQVLS